MIRRDATDRPNLGWRKPWAGLGEQTVTTKTLRRRFFSLAGWLTRSARASPGIFPSAGPGNPSSVRADSDHQDPPAPVLLSRRMAHPLGAPPHPASSPALALGTPVQSRPGPAACPATPNLTAPVRHRPDVRPTERPRQLAPSRSATASCCVLSRHFGHHRHCRPPSAPPKAPTDRPPISCLPEFRPGSSPP